MTDTPLPPGGWHPDPSGRHRLRFWDGTTWTEYVSDAGETARDPLPGSTPAEEVAAENAAEEAPTGTARDLIVATGVAADAAQPAVPRATPPVSEPPPSVEVTSPGRTPGAPWGTLSMVTGALPPARRDVGGLAGALTVVLWVSVAVGVLGVVAFVNRVLVIEDVLDFDGSFAALADLQRRLDDADVLVGVFVVLTVACMLTVFVLLVIWMWRVAKNGELLGRTNPRFAPGWTIGGWLIPVADLVVPLMVMQELWRATNPATAPGDAEWRTTRGSVSVGCWWLAFLASGAELAALGSEAQTRSELQTLRTTDAIAGFGSLVATVAAILLVHVVRAITRRQRALFGDVVR